MKFKLSASSIVALLALFIVSACEDVRVPHVFARDEVPDAVKAQPRIVTTPSPDSDEDKVWPMVGTVPFKPNDFSTKPVYNHYMNELEYERDEAGAAKNKALVEDPIPGDLPQVRE